jgi:hypothetical protein
VRRITGKRKIMPQRYVKAVLIPQTRPIARRSEQAFPIADIAQALLPRKKAHYTRRTVPPQRSRFVSMSFKGRRLGGGRTDDSTSAFSSDNRYFRDW